jgi:4-amino-4-deoxy-L-arabinose transferase and related glycosyltransferases of PMT family
MIKYRKTVELTSWILGILTSILYIACCYPSVSFWDCGEYMLSSSHLEIGHPAGAIVYQLLGAFFSIFTFGNASLTPLFTTALSAIASGASVSFLFLIIVRLMYRFSRKHTSNIMVGVIGALILAFSDTFFSSATETEVYAFAMFFITVILWAALKWDDGGGEKWFLFIVFMLSLSIGVHLMCLLTIPSICLIVYFHYRKPTIPGFFTSIIIGCLILFALLWGILPYTIKFIGLAPILTMIVLAVILIGLIVLSHYKRLPLLNSSAIGVLLFLIGLSPLWILVIRAQANTPVNEYCPKDTQRLVSYIQRDAFGSTPLIYGPAYTAMPAKSYTVDSKGIQPVFEREMKMFFPRTWNYTSPSYENGYVGWIGLPQDTVLINGQIRPKPSLMQNMQFFLSYQIGYMYVRYLLWNFVGKTNDRQGYGANDDGQWVSGIKPIDKFFSKETIDIPVSKSGRHIYFAIPFFLAIIGILYQLGRDAKGFLVLVTLFIFTSIAIVVFNNEYAYQPRERDYAYVASFMVFAIWCAMGCFAISHWIVAMVRIRKPKYVLPCFVLVPAILFANNIRDHNHSHDYTAYNFALSTLNSCKQNAILFVNGDNDTFPLWYLQEVEGVRKDVRVINLNLLNDNNYISSLKRTVYDSSKIKLLAPQKAIENPFFDITFFTPSSGRFDLAQSLQALYSEKYKINLFGYSFFCMPSNKFSLTFDSTDSFVLNVEDDQMNKSTMILYDIIASNIKDRPIYFSNYSIDSFFGFDEYLVNEGFVSRLLSKKYEPQDLIVDVSLPVNSNAMYKNFISSYSWRNFSHSGVYYNELSRSIIDLYASQTSLLAHTLLAEGQNSKALIVADMFCNNVPLDIVSDKYPLSTLAFVYSSLGQEEKAENVLQNAITSWRKDISYYLLLSDKERSSHRLSASELISRWIYTCRVAQDWGAENLRIMLANSLFDYLNKYASTLPYEMKELQKNPSYYSVEIENLRNIATDIYSFADEYEEPMPQTSLSPTK